MRVSVEECVSLSACECRGVHVGVFLKDVESRI